MPQRDDVRDQGRCRYRAAGQKINRGHKVLSLVYASTDDRQFAQKHPLEVDLAGDWMYRDNDDSTADLRQRCCRQHGSR